MLKSPAREVLQYQWEVVEVLFGVREHPSDERIKNKGGDQGSHRSVVVFKRSRNSSGFLQIVSLTPRRTLRKAEKIPTGGDRAA